MATKKQAAAAAPASVTLLSPYGWYDESGESPKFYSCGQVVTDATEVADLLARKAPLDGVDYEAV